MVEEVFATLPSVTSIFASNIDNHEKFRELGFELPPKHFNVTSLTF